MRKFADKVHKLTKGQYKESEVKEMTEDIRISHNMIQSRFQEVHGPVGLVQVSVSQVNSMREIRMLRDYGDLMVINCESLRSRYNELIWNKERKDWVTVTEEIDK